MGASKIAISLDEKLLTRLDRLVQTQVFPSRSKVFREAVREKLERFDQSRLARECKKLCQQFEQALEDEGLVEEEKEWPEY